VRAKHEHRWRTHTILKVNMLRNTLFKITAYLNCEKLLPEDEVRRVRSMSISGEHTQRQLLSELLRTAEMDQSELRGEKDKAEAEVRRLAAHVTHLTETALPQKEVHMCTCTCMCTCACVCACVCVRERERVRKSEGERERSRERERDRKKRINGVRMWFKSFVSRHR